MGTTTSTAIIRGADADARRSGWCPSMTRRPRGRRPALVRPDSSSA
ncbi:hypothetical protein V1L54_00855 [Streptomyces sp. TRM 70361]|nr:hypothetical protein [Streptomyces sp. TRM 70361]MEE1937979.1 hypothetical protein [Streptomyces sp. TRM 70361]